MIVTYLDEGRKRVMQLGEYEAKKWTQLDIKNPNFDDVLEFFGVPEMYTKKKINNALKLVNSTVIEACHFKKFSKYVPLNK